MTTVVKNEMAYAAVFPGKPGYGAITVDSPEDVKDTAKYVADWIRKGATVERVSCSAAQAGMLKYWKWKKINETIQP